MVGEKFAEVNGFLTRITPEKIKEMAHKNRENNAFSINCVFNEIEEEYECRKWWQKYYARKKNRVKTEIKQRQINWCETCDCQNNCDTDWLEQAMCIRMNYIWWDPKNKEMCKGCRMRGFPDEGDSKQCYRHAQPCWLRDDMDVDIYDK